jgi:hypothetical protein
MADQGVGCGRGRPPHFDHTQSFDRIWLLTGDAFLKLESKIPIPVERLQRFTASVQYVP